MADKGKSVGDMEYGRVPYAGTYVGDMEYGRCPGIGYKYFPVLTVQSTPSSGVSITVSPSDINGQGNGTTEFTRDYEKDTDVSLTAPGTFGELVFSTWKVDGSPIEGNPIVVTMDTDHTTVAIFVGGGAPLEEIKGTEMLYVKLPRHKFWMANYPNLDPDSEGRPLPIGWGEIKNTKPVCVDTEAFKFKLIDNYGRAIKSVDAVRDGVTTLVLNDDYTVDLNEATITLQSTPVLQPNTLYYFVIESDYPINGSDYLRWAQSEGSIYAGGQRFDINAAGVWTPVDADLFFMIFVKDSPEGDFYKLIDNYNDVTWGELNVDWNMGAILRKTTDNVRIAQSFTTPATGGPWYVYDIIIEPHMGSSPRGIVGFPPATRKTKFAILSSKDPEVQIGIKSNRLEEYSGAIGVFPTRVPNSDIRVDFKSVKNPDDSLMENVADILKDSYVTIMDGSESALDATALANLKAARTEPLLIWIDEEIQYREFLDKLEVGQFFKFLPTLDWKFTVLYAQAGEPSGTIHFRDEDFLDFKCFRKWSSVYQKVKVKFYEDCSMNEWQVRETTSNIAQFCYRNQRTLEVETFLKNAADAVNCSSTFLGLVETPQRIIEFSVSSGKGFGLIPWQKVKITRSRVDAPDGKLDGVLFRILEIKQNVLMGAVTITAILDDQTY